MKKFIALFLVFSILALSGNMFAKERKGAELVVQRVDKIRVRGELIAVKQDSILLLEKYSGADMIIDFRDIEVIKIVGKSKSFAGCITGLFLGGVIGYFIGYPQGDEGPIVFVSEPLAGAIGAAIGGVLGALVGVGIGTAVGSDKTIQIEGKPDSEIQEIMEKLSKKARIKNLQ